MTYSPTLSAVLLSRSVPFSFGKVQLFTPHHHRLALAPTVCPLNFEDELKTRQPETMSVQAMPCTRGITSYGFVSIFARLGGFNSLYLVPGSDEHDALPTFGVLYAG